MRGVPRERRAISLAPSLVMPTPSTRAARDDQFEFGFGVEIQPHRNAEAVAQRIGEQARARGCADQCEFRQFDLHRARCRPLADNQIELEILHRRIEHLLPCGLSRWISSMQSTSRSSRLVSKRREIAGLGNHRSGRGAEIHAELARHDLRQRGLAEAGRADEQHVIERIPCALSRR